MKKWKKLFLQLIPLSLIISPSLWADASQDLMDAILDQDLVSVEELSKNKSVDLNTVNEEGYTLLHLAIVQSEMISNLDPIVKTLIDVGADVNKKKEYPSENKWTSLHEAVFRYMVTGIGRKIIEELLQNEKIDVNARDTHGRTVLHIAVFPEWMGRLAPAFGGNIDVIKQLLAHKDINVNIMDENGNTPLDLISVRWGEHQGVREGLYLRLKINKGEKPDQTTQFKFLEVIKLLRSKGGGTIDGSVCRQIY